MQHFLTSVSPPSWAEGGIFFEFWRNFVYADRYRLILSGLWLTIQITIAAVAIGLVLGFFMSLMRISKRKPLNMIATTYITVIRGIPIPIQLMLWLFVVGTEILPGASSTVLAILGLGINSSAYVTEIFRGGILSVDKGQTEAGRSVGLSTVDTMRLIILPQAIKNALPALGNELITLLKLTSIAGLLGIQEITLMSNTIRSRTFSWLPLLTLALIYLVMVLLLTWLMGKMERRLRKSDSR